MEGNKLLFNPERVRGVYHPYEISHIYIPALKFEILISCIHIDNSMGKYTSVSCQFSLHTRCCDYVFKCLIK